MPTTAVERIFVDTNVLVYATQVTAPWHAEANQTLTALHAAGAELWISRPVLREYLATLSRPQTFSAPLASHHSLFFFRRSFLAARKVFNSLSSSAARVCISSSRFRASSMGSSLAPVFKS